MKELQIFLNESYSLLRIFKEEYKNIPDEKKPKMHGNWTDVLSVILHFLWKTEFELSDMIKRLERYEAENAEA